MFRIALILLLSLVAFLCEADQFPYPPQQGAIGEIISDLSFTVGQTIAMEWTSSSLGDLSFWLVRDASGSQCTFQSNAQCARIAGKSDTVYAAYINRGKACRLSLMYIQCRRIMVACPDRQQTEHGRPAQRYLLHQCILHLGSNKWRGPTAF
jgi:hypothetical protein